MRAIDWSRAGPSVTVLVVLTVALYSFNLGGIEHPDELYHLLAAQGVVAQGEPVIGESGRYWRGYSYTWLVAQSVSVLGPTLTAARLPAVVFMVALVALLFLFLYREGGLLAGWLGAGLFAVSPFSIDIAQFARFYSLQCLVFFAGAWLIYELARVKWSWLWHTSIAVLALLLLLFATDLQKTTLLGIAGIGLWLVGVAFVRLKQTTLPSSSKALITIVAFALAALAIIGSWVSGLLLKLWIEFRSTPLFNADTANEFWYYFLQYFILYPTLITLSGLIPLLALRKNTRATLFLLSIFVVGFILNSIAGAKNTRYIAYAQPFLFALWGIGLASLAELGRDGFRRLVEELQKTLSGSSQYSARLLTHGLVAVAFLSLLLANPAWLRSATLLTDVTLPTQVPPTDWQQAHPVLAPWLDDVDIVVTTEELGPLFHYGRADLLLSASKYQEQPPDRQVPFVPDFRTDVPMINNAEDLRLAMGCVATGLFLTQTKHWGPAALRLRDEAVEELVKSRATPLDLPARSQILGFVWQEENPVLNAAACEQVSVAR